MNVSPTSADIQRRADEAAARGAFDEARALLEQAVGQGGGSFDLHMKRAAMARASGDPNSALSALSDALAIAPLDFMALLMRATLLDQAGSPEAGEAYGRAIAQRPAGNLPPSVASTLHRAQQRHAEYVARTAHVLSEAMAPAEKMASQAQRDRMARFRTNALRQTRVWHSEPTHFHYPGLAEREFHDRDPFPWLAALEAATDAIEADFHRVAAAERAEMVPYIQYPQDVPLRQWADLNHSRAWTAIHLLQNGRRIEANARHCPATMAVLEHIPQPDMPGRSPNAMFSLLAPHTAIPPHNGVANTRLVCHLPLIVPPACRFRVGAETREWERGQAFVFDDTIEHEAVNDSGALRVVLIIDVWHPGLDPVERDAIAAMMIASGEASGAAL